MPYQVSIDEETRTVVVKGTGAGTTADTLQLIRDQQDLFRRCAGYRFLYDSSELQIASSPGELMQVADALFAQARASFSKFAIVVPESRAALASIFTALAHPHGVHANMFTDVDDARRWLGLAD